MNIFEALAKQYGPQIPKQEPKPEVPRRQKKPKPSLNHPWNQAQRIGRMESEQKKKMFVPDPRFTPIPKSEITERDVQAGREMERKEIGEALLGKMLDEFGKPRRSVSASSQATGQTVAATAALPGRQEE